MIPQAIHDRDCFNRKLLYNAAILGEPDAHRRGAIGGDVEESDIYPTGYLITSGLGLGRYRIKAEESGKKPDRKLPESVHRAFNAYGVPE
jgi:hypothetical protein